MDLGLGGRGFLLTGASRGLGFATARALVDDGARVLISSRSAESVDAAVSALGPAASGVPADGDPSGLRAGQEVVVRADDRGRDPIRGALVAADAEEVVIRHENERVGAVHTHFPRAGFEVLAA